MHERGSSVQLALTHRHAAHCESGVVSSLLTHAGLPISEAMAFGISGALTFAHLPFPRVHGFPLTAYRKPPGTITKKVARRLGVRMHVERHRSPEAGQRALDRYLDAGQPVGLQASVYWLPYFPPDMRFHFNAHHMIAYGRDGDEYLLSDPVFENAQRCNGKALSKARSVRGWFSPRNVIFFPRSLPAQPNIAGAARRAIRSAAFQMITAPLWFGVRGIRHMARGLRKLAQKSPDPRWTRMYVAQIIRMQEEIGTGGGGFRFMYASFLEEAATLLDVSELRDGADRVAKAGDLWREFASAGAHFIRQKEGYDLERIAGLVEQCADAEHKAFSTVYRAMRGLPPAPSQVMLPKAD